MREKDFLPSVKTKRRGGGTGETEGEEKIVNIVNEKGQKPPITASSKIGHCLIRQWPIVP